MKFLIAIAIIAILAMASVKVSVYAASMADVQTGDNSNSNNNSTGAVASAGAGNNDNGAIAAAGSSEPGKMFITILPDKPIVDAGSDIGYTITARSENGSVIPDANISSMVVDYGSSKNRLLMSGETNSKGEFKITTQLG